MERYYTMSYNNYFKTPFWKKRNDLCENYAESQANKKYTVKVIDMSSDKEKISKEDNEYNEKE